MSLVVGMEGLGFLLNKYMDKLARKNIRMVIRKWSAMETISHIICMFFDWVRSNPSVEIFPGMI